jgi:hypothetical protein
MSKTFSEKIARALCSLGPNGSILKVDGTPYAIVDRGTYTQVNVRRADSAGRIVFQTKQLVVGLLGIPYDPKTHRIVHKDGNYHNCKPENLSVVRRTQPTRKLCAKKR